MQIPQKVKEHPWAVALTAIVAGVGIAGTLLGWETVINSVREFVGRPAIVASSGREKGAFFAGEKVWFTLENVDAGKVYWLVEEQKLVEGSIQLDHTFAFDSARTRGQKRKHRVDAFFRDGDSYRTAKLTVESINMPMVAASLGADRLLSLRAEEELKGWVLAEANVASYQNGRFENVGGVAFSAAPASNVFSLDLKEQLADPAPTAQHGFVSLTFTNARDPAARLNLVKPLRGLRIR